MERDMAVCAGCGRLIFLNASEHLTIEASGHLHRDCRAAYEAEYGPVVCEDDDEAAVKVSFEPIDGREPSASIAHSCGCFSWWAPCTEHHQNAGPFEAAAAMSAPLVAVNDAPVCVRCSGVRPKEMDHV